MMVIESLIFCKNRAFLSNSTIFYSVFLSILLIFLFISLTYFVSLQANRLWQEKEQKIN